MKKKKRIIPFISTLVPDEMAIIRKVKQPTEIKEKTITFETFQQIFQKLENKVIPTITALITVNVNACFKRDLKEELKVEMKNNLEKFTGQLCAEVIQNEVKVDILKNKT